MNLQPRQIFFVLFLLSLGVFGLYPVATAQKSTQQTPKSTSRPEFSLKISTKDLITLSLKAERAQLASIAREISKSLKIPVLLGRSVEAREVTTDFKGLTLEPALHLLAPEVYIDYEINRAPGVEAQPVGIYLNGYDDPAPAINAVVPNSSQTMLIEGDTEEGVEDPAVGREGEEPATSRDI